MSQKEEFEKIVMDVFDIDISEINDETTPDDLELWDSVTHMDLVARFEDTFDLQFEVEEITEMDTIGNMKEVLRRSGVEV